MEHRDFGVVEQREWQVAIRGEDGTPQVIDLHYERKLPEVSEQDLRELFVTQAKPTRIAKSKKQTAVNTEATVYMGDEHFPFADQRAIALGRMATREIAPANIVLLGDIIDFTNFSKYPSKKAWADNTQRSFDEAHEHLAGLRADNPQANIVLHDSNHTIRTERKVQEYNGDLVGLKRANSEELSVLSVEFLLRLGELGIDFLRGYPSVETMIDGVKSFHGMEAVASGSTMARVIGRETVSVVQGHSHRRELVFRTFRDGMEDKTIFGMNPGCLANIAEAPKDTHSTDARGNVVPPRVNWQQGIGATFDGSPVLLPIDDSKILIHGKRYAS